MSTNILIAGIGGVGGFFGGLLANEFFQSPEVNVSFLARGAHLQKIQTEGLKIEWGTKILNVRPYKATDHAAILGEADFILLCTKSYDLVATIEQIKPCINANTVIIPFLNGVDSVHRIQKLLPNNTIAGGCVYIVSSIKEPGIVRNTGNIQKLFLGLNGERNQRLLQLVNWMQQAGIEAQYSDNILNVMWEKFYLVAANSTATSYFNLTTGQILAEPDMAKMMELLLKEVNLVASARGIFFETDMVETTARKISNLPFETTSSMQRDFWKKDGRTELETITGYIVASGLELNIPTPTFQAMYESLLLKKTI